MPKLAISILVLIIVGLLVTIINEQSQPEPLSTPALYLSDRGRLTFTYLPEQGVENARMINVCTYTLKVSRINGTIEVIKSLFIRERCIYSQFTTIFQDDRSYFCSSISEKECERIRTYLRARNNGDLKLSEGEFILQDALQMKDGNYIETTLQQLVEERKTK